MRYCRVLMSLGFLLFIAGCTSTEDSSARTGIITMGPHLTETVFALDKGHEVIAVGRFDDYPPQIESLPKAGGYIDPDLEKITLLQPGLLVLPGEQPSLSEFAAQQGFEVLNVHMDSFHTIQTGVLTLGTALKATEIALSLIQQFGDEQMELIEKLAGVDRPKVLIITTRESHDLNNLYTVGGTSFVSEVVDLAGGDNIFDDTEQAYFEASKESVVAAAPDVIVEFHAGSTLSEAEAQAYRDDWQAMAILPAVKQNRIILVTQSHALRPGLRIVEIAESIAAELHPEAMAKDH